MKLLAILTISLTLLTALTVAGCTSSKIATWVNTTDSGDSAIYKITFDTKDSGSYEVLKPNGERTGGLFTYSFNTVDGYDLVVQNGGVERLKFRTGL